jgi:hypothetical protein
MIPAFNTTGVLPLGRYPTDVAEVEQRFVDTFPSSATRAGVFRGWRMRCEELLSIVPIAWEWIDGSFVTSKSNASDVDVATFIRAEDLEHLTVPDRQRVLSLTVGPAPKLQFGCDSYLVVIFDDAHPRHGQYLAARGYWDNWWSRHDVAQGKGYIEVREVS